VAVQVPASRKGAKQSARISEPEMHPSVQQKALLWVFLTDFFWSVKKSMTNGSVDQKNLRIDDLSVLTGKGTNKVIDSFTNKVLD
jgi:hypothetical protein